jgi:hypothetical protein
VGYGEVYPQIVYPRVVYPQLDAPTEPLHAEEQEWVWDPPIDEDPEGDPWTDYI